MKKDIQLPWIEVGYLTFAQKGPEGLKVERLAKAVGKNKSSFYHLFADLEVFTNFLLQHHLVQATVLAEKEIQSSDLASFIQVLIEHKTDLLFNRQLRINRTKPAFETCFSKTNEFSAPAISGIWSKILGLENNSHLAALFFKLSVENFYLQITEETLNETWLQQYFLELQNLIKAFKRTGKIPVLDGSV